MNDDCSRCSSPHRFCCFGCFFLGIFYRSIFYCWCFPGTTPVCRCPSWCRRRCSPGRPCCCCSSRGCLSLGCILFLAPVLALRMNFLLACFPLKTPFFLTGASGTAGAGSASAVVSWLFPASPPPICALVQLPGLRDQRRSCPNDGTLGPRGPKCGTGM